MKYFLLVEVGNTKTDIAVSDSVARIMEKSRVSTSKSGPLPEWFSVMREFRDRYGTRVCGVSSVVPELDITIREMVFDLGMKLCQVDPRECRERVSIPVPGELGSDRLCNTIYAFSKNIVPAVIVDAGTATTFDVVDVRGRYIGGVIFPGIETSAFALSLVASKIKSVEIDFPPNFLAGTTSERAIQAGVFYSQVFAINGLIAAFRNQIPGVTVLGTGGVMRSVEKYIDLDILNFNLTLEGLARYTSYR